MVVYNPYVVRTIPTPACRSAAFCPTHPARVWYHKVGYCQLSSILSNTVYYINSNNTTLKWPSNQITLKGERKSVSGYSDRYDDTQEATEPDITSHNYGRGKGSYRDTMYHDVPRLNHSQRIIKSEVVFTWQTVWAILRPYDQEVDRVHPNTDTSSLG